MENELSRLVDALPGLIWTALPNGEADFLNQQWLAYTGLSAGQAYGLGWIDAVHPEDIPDLLVRWQSTLASGEPRELEARLRRFDGEYRRFVFHARPIVDASGAIVKWCGINTDVEDRRRAEDAQKEQDNRFQLTFDGLPTHVALSNAGGEIERANRNYLEYFGAPLDELKLQGRYHNCHPDDRPTVLAAHAAGIAAGQPFELETRRRRFDGIYRWFKIRYSPVRDSNGRISFWYLLQSDIDDQKRAENLLAGEKQLLEMVASGASLSAVLDTLCLLVEDAADGCSCSVVLVDPTGTRLEHGAAPSLPPAFTASIIGRPVNLDSGPCAMAAFLNEQVIAADLATETRWEPYRWCPMALSHGLRAAWSTPFSSTDGRVLGAFALYWNAPGSPTSLHQNLIERFAHLASIGVERVQKDTAIRRNEAFLTQAQHLSQTASFYWRVATEEITWSEEAYRLFELDRSGPITNELIYSRIHPEDRAYLFGMMDKARHGEVVDFAYEHRLLMPDKRIKYVSMACHGARDAKGDLEYIAAVQDITERRQSEEALGKARSDLTHVARVSSLGALTASIAHEVNQPLSGILMNAGTCLRLLDLDPPDIGGAQGLVQRITRDSNRASHVIAQLRSLFSKKEAAAELVDLNEAIREVIALSRSELQRLRVVLQLEFTADLPRVIGDRIQLQQVILNLLLNAAEAMREIDDRPRQLTIRTVQDDDAHVQLTVQDAGTGFDPQAVEKLFDAFYTTKNGGMGIGLSVSRSIIENHHGRLWALANEGPGATFSFALPSQPLEAPTLQTRHAVSNA